ncbi:MAG: CHAP domain-containing protein [Protaetiibacter sp.]
MDSAADRRPAQLSRRMLIGGAAGMSALAAVGVDLSLPIAARAQTALDAAVAEALSLVGRNVSQVNEAMVPSAWKNTAPAAWCAWFASYICRAAGVTRNISAPGLYNSLPHYSTPARGDIIFYINSDTAGHVGFVADVVNGVARTIEGNTTGDPTIVKAYSQPWGGFVGFARPNWTDAPSPSIQGDEVLTFITKDSSSAWYVTNGLVKRILAPGENQLLVDLGLVKWPDGIAGNVKVIGQTALDRIPTIT